MNIQINRVLLILSIFFVVFDITITANYQTEQFKYKGKIYNQQTNSQCVQALGRTYCLSENDHIFDIQVRERHRYDTYNFYNNENGNYRLNEGSIDNYSDQSTWSSFLNKPSIFKSEFIETHGGSASFTFSTMRHKFYGHFYNCGYLGVTYIDNGQCKIKKGVEKTDLNNIDDLAIDYFSLLVNNNILVPLDKDSFYSVVSPSITTIEDLNQAFDLLTEINQNQKILLNQFFQPKFEGELPSSFNTPEQMVGRLDFISSEDYNDFHNPQSFINRYDQNVTEKLSFNFMKYYLSELVIRPSETDEILTMVTFFDVWMHDKIYPHSFYAPNPNEIPSIVNPNTEQFIVDIKIKYKVETSLDTVIFEFPFIETHPSFDETEFYPEYIVQRLFFEITNNGSLNNETVETYLMSHAPGEPDDIYDSQYYSTHHPQSGTYKFESLFYLDSYKDTQFKIQKTFSDQAILLDLIKSHLVNQPEDYSYVSNDNSISSITNASSTLKMPPDFFHKLFESENLPIYKRNLDTNTWDIVTDLSMRIDSDGGVAIMHGADKI